MSKKNKTDFDRIKEIARKYDSKIKVHQPDSNCDQRGLIYGERFIISNAGDNITSEWKEIFVNISDNYSIQENRLLDYPPFCDAYLKFIKEMEKEKKYKIDSRPFGIKLEFNEKSGDKLKGAIETVMVMSEIINSIYGDEVQKHFDRIKYQYQIRSKNISTLCS